MQKIKILKHHLLMISLTIFFQFQGAEEATNTVVCIEARRPERTVQVFGKYFRGEKGCGCFHLIPWGKDSLKIALWFYRDFGSL